MVVNGFACVPCNINQRNESFLTTLYVTVRTERVLLLNYLVILLNQRTTMSTSKGVAAAKPRATVTGILHAKTTTPTQNKTVARSVSKTQNAIAILRTDQTLVNDYFSKYGKTCSVPKENFHFAQMYEELSMQAQVDEEMLHSAAKLAFRDRDLMPEVSVENETLKEMTSQVKGEVPDGKTFDKKISDLSKYVKPLVQEQPNEVFPEVKSTKLDIPNLSAQILAQKRKLMPQTATKEQPFLHVQYQGRNRNRSISCSAHI